MNYRFLTIAVLVIVSSALSFTDTLLSKSGKYSITWGFDDSNGNTATVLQIVFIRDTAAPVPQKIPLDTIRAQCSITVTDTPTAYDKFLKKIINGKTASLLSYDRQGVYTILWYYYDGKNTSYQNQVVKIKDTIAPDPIVATLPTITVDSTYLLKSPKAIDNCRSNPTDTVFGRIVQIVLDTTVN
jgi:hypothetical protein